MEENYQHGLGTNMENNASNIEIVIDFDPLFNKVRRPDEDEDGHRYSRRNRNSDVHAVLHQIPSRWNGMVLLRNAGEKDLDWKKKTVAKLISYQKKHLVRNFLSDYYRPMLFTGKDNAICLLETEIEFE